MPYHLVQSIFINLPITIAYDKLWELISLSDGLEPYSHYFKINKIKKLKKQSFQRQIALRIVNSNKNSAFNDQQVQSNIKITQQIMKNDKQRRITYNNINNSLVDENQVISGEFYHKFEQNNKGQVYLIFASSARKGKQKFPEKSQAEIQLIKIKDLIQNGLQEEDFIKNKSKQCGFKQIC